MFGFVFWLMLCKRSSLAKKQWLILWFVNSLQKDYAAKKIWVWRPQFSVLLLLLLQKHLFPQNQNLISWYSDDSKAEPVVHEQSIASSHGDVATYGAIHSFIFKEAVRDVVR
jgi:hypothetical protein